MLRRRGIAWGRPGRLRDDLTCVGLLAASLGLAWSYSQGRILWSDELFGWMLVTDPSPRHMLGAWRAGADGGGLWFYLLARLWLRCFGASATAFRLFSAMGVGVAAVLTFRLARRYFAWGVAAFCVVLVWFSSDIVLWQMMQGRFYGMLLAATAAASSLWVLTDEAGKAGVRLTRMSLGLTFLAHTLLLGTHPLGMLYSGMLIALMLARDAARHRLRPRLYAAALAGWWVLLPSTAAIRHTAAVGKPHFWTTRPGLADLGNTYSCWSLETGIALGLCAGCLALLLAGKGRFAGRLWRDVRANASPLLVAAALLSVPLLVFLKSQYGTSLFVDRYLLPVVIGSCLLLCQLLTWILAAGSRPSQASRLPRSLAVGACASLLVAAVWVAVVQFPGFWVYPGPDDNVGLLRLLPRDVPIVVEPVDRFDQLLFYHRQAGYRFVYLLDWENATAPGSPRGEVSGYHEMENWRKEGYFAGAIRETAPFLASTPVFAVVDDPGTLWFERRILPDPRFQVTSLGFFHHAADMTVSKVWLVRRRGDTL